jgi:hypothetical protein
MFCKGRYPSHNKRIPRARIIRIEKQKDYSNWPLALAINYSINKNKN